MGSCIFHTAMFKCHCSQKSAIVIHFNEILLAILKGLRCQFDCIFHSICSGIADTGFRNIHHLSNTGDRPGLAFMIFPHAAFFRITVFTKNFSRWCCTNHLIQRIRWDNGITGFHQVFKGITAIWIFFDNFKRHHAMFLCNSIIVLDQDKRFRRIF
ncbi:MAG: hypothetical protein OMM_03809 [Candidatus Magnetoglobus multicellularis str. Araruama]|uniref:Uncharacterized protein n=1 Tax=Candidatus Magnetoglobus multicellularis str. Araruama TaxID=890399 RepID=A0A1V1P449_9BACT|nr:MAG: hypothetical protein OMM_03809 [Candidatus Magnetoglobus multicellularis str. Araruama]